MSARTPKTGRENRPDESLARQWRTVRYNPISQATPASLTRALDEFEAGWLRNAALLWEAICDRDDMVRPCSLKRLGSVSVRPFEIVRIEESPEAEKHEAALRFFFDNVTVTSALDLNVRGTFSELCEQMMTAQLMHYAVHEVMWQPGARDAEGRPAMTAELRFVPLYLFENTSGRLRYTGPLTATNGTELEPGEWMITVGDGIMRAVSVAWMFKRLSLSDWLQYSEKFGIPGIHGTTPAQKGTPEFDAFVDALEAFASDWVMASAQGSEVKLIEVGKTGDAPFAPMVERMDRQIAILMLGSDLATLSRDNGTGASLQGDSAATLFARDCKRIASTLQTQLARPVIEHLFGRGVRPLAYIEIAPPQQQDVAQDMKIDDHLAKHGIDQDPEDLAQRYGRTLPEGFGEDDVPEGAPAPDESADLENAWQDQPRDRRGRWVKLGPGDTVVRAGQTASMAEKARLAAAAKLASELGAPKRPSPEEVDLAWKMIRQGHEDGSSPVKAFDLAREQVVMAAGPDIDRETWLELQRRVAESSIARPSRTMDEAVLHRPTYEAAWDVVKKEHAAGRPLEAFEKARAVVLKARKRQFDDAAWRKVRAEYDEFYRRDPGAGRPKAGSDASAPFRPAPLRAPGQRPLGNTFNATQPRDAEGRWVNSKGQPIKFTGDPMPPPDDESCLEGTCVSEDQITDAVGGLDEFQALIDQHGDDFEHNGTRVTYNPRTREHFFWRKPGRANEAENAATSPAAKLRAAIAADLRPAHDAIAAALQGDDADLRDSLEKLNADWDDITDRILAGDAAETAMEAVLGTAFLDGLDLTPRTEP